MEHVEVIDAHGRVIASGHVCDLCLCVAGKVDVFDVGIAERGIHACSACIGEVEEVIDSRERFLPEPEEFGLVLGEAC